MIRGIIIVLSRWRYAAFAAAIVLALFLFSAWFPNRQLLRFAASSEVISFWKLIWQSPQFFVINATLFSASLALGVIVLSGVNIAMLVFYLVRKVQSDHTAGAGLAGTLVGLLGVGCAACGSVILTSLFGLGAASGFLGLLPFNGIEFGILGIAALIASIAFLAQKIQNPDMCAISR